MNPNKTTKLFQGMTLLEIVLAIAVIGFILTIYAQIFVRNYSQINQTRSNTVAYNWAADKMEDIKQAYLYDDITAGVWAAETEVLGENRSFTRIVTVSQIQTGLKEVEVEVTWTENNRNLDVRIVSCVADYED